MVSVKVGNIFNTKYNCIVVPVNCVGVMGAGLAKQFKFRYPLIFDSYKRKCKTNSIKTGKIYLYDESDDNFALLFPTKEHWKNESKIEYIESGLDYFIKNYQKIKECGVNGVAFPMLGCGCGGLDKTKVLNIMINKFNNLDIDIEIYTN